MKIKFYATPDHEDGGYQVVAESHRFITVIASFDDKKKAEEIAEAFSSIPVFVLDNWAKYADSILRDAGWRIGPWPPILK